MDQSHHCFDGSLWPWMAPELSAYGNTCSSCIKRNRNPPEEIFKTSCSFPSQDEHRHLHTTKHGTTLSSKILKWSIGKRRFQECGTKLLRSPQCQCERLGIMHLSAIFPCHGFHHHRQPVALTVSHQPGCLPHEGSLSGMAKFHRTAGCCRIQRKRIFCAPQKFFLKAASQHRETACQSEHQPKTAGPCIKRGMQKPPVYQHAINTACSAECSEGCR